MLGLAVVGAVLYTLFQKSAPAFGLFVSMGAAVLVLWKISTAAEIAVSYTHLTLPTNSLV